MSLACSGCKEPNVAFYVCVCICADVWATVYNLSESPNSPLVSAIISKAQAQKEQNLKTKSIIPPALYIKDLDEALLPTFTLMLCYLSLLFKV